MKLLRTLLFLGFAVVPASASDIEKNRADETGKKYKEYEAGNGQVYREVTITKITDAGVSIMHADGSTRLGYERLTAEQREKFGITKEDAEAVYAKEMKARAAYEAQLAAARKERQKAHQELLAKETAALAEAQRLEAERLNAQSLVAKPAQEQPGTASIVSTLEVPRFPIIRGYENQVLYPIQNVSGPQRITYYRSSGTTYPVRYGNTYYYPGYPSSGSYCNPSHHRGYSGWLNYRRGNFSISTHW